MELKNVPSREGVEGGVGVVRGGVGVVRRGGGQRELFSWTITHHGLFCFLLRSLGNMAVCLQ